MSNIPEPLLYWFHALTNNPRRVIGTNPKTIPHKRGSIIFWHFLHFSFTIVTQRHFFVTTSSSSAAEKNLKMKIWKRFFIVCVILLISSFFFYFNLEKKNLDNKSEVNKSILMFNHTYNKYIIKYCFNSPCRLNDINLIYNRINFEYYL